MPERADSSLSERRTAPIQGGGRDRRPDVRIPWDIHVRAWQVYAAAGYGDQSAERIAERGGFGYSELVMLLGEVDPFAQRPLTARQGARLERLRAANAEADAS
jgi:hypothetical protein